MSDWKLVPVTPTGDMIEQGAYEFREGSRGPHDDVDPANLYRAMVMAAPKPPEDAHDAALGKLAAMYLQRSNEMAALRAQLAAEREKSADLRRRILRAMSVEAEANVLDAIQGDPLNDAFEAMGVSLSVDDWHAVEAKMHPLPLGTLVLSAEGESDSDEHDNERFTGSCAVGEIVSADPCVTRTTPDGALLNFWTYGVTFGNGTHVLIEEGELADPDAYLVANSPFIAPEGV